MNVHIFTKNAFIMEPDDRKIAKMKMKCKRKNSLHFDFGPVSKKKEQDTNSNHKLLMNLLH
jgi:hypothetical protein